MDSRSRTNVACESTAICSPSSALEVVGIGVEGGARGKSQPHQRHSQPICWPSNGFGWAGGPLSELFAQLHGLFAPEESQQHGFPLAPWQHDLIADGLGLAFRALLGTTGASVAGHCEFTQLQARTGLAVVATENATTSRRQRNGRTRPEIDMLESYPLSHIQVNPFRFPGNGTTWNGIKYLRANRRSV